jgi:hypothetical protein
MKQWAIGLMSNEEKRNILDKHRSLYDGYRTMQPQMAKEQPLYVQDFAGDKNGITVNNKFNVKGYTNVGINESEEKGMCSECGGRMYEGECMECGYGGNMEESECVECGSNYEMEEEMQQVKDLKKVEDLNMSDKFDYVESDMMEDDSLDALSMQDYTGQEGPHDEKDMAPDGMSDDSDDNRKMMADGEIDETQQGNPYDNEESAYDFVSNGPLQEYDPMESAWSDDEEMDDREELHSSYSDDEFIGMSKDSGDMEHIEETNDDGIPPQLARFFKKVKRKSKAEREGEEFDDNELDMSDYGEFEPNTSSWGEITAITGEDEFSHLDEDIKESVVRQKNRILEMMSRMKRF